MFTTNICTQVLSLSLSHTQRETETSRCVIQRLNLPASKARHSEYRDDTVTTEQKLAKPVMMEKMKNTKLMLHSPLAALSHAEKIN